LFICSANRNRSKAAERLCKQISQAKGEDIQCESAGVNPLAVKQVTKKAADRADIIFVMEDYMKATLIKEYQQPPGKIICLDIPDIYFINDPELEMILKQKLEPYF
jgi:predicted protein tyrosine phosphatase